MVDLIPNHLYDCFSDLWFVKFAGENAEKLLQFKRWFWSIVEKMSMTERQDLVRHYYLQLLIFQLECKMMHKWVSINTHWYVYGNKQGDTQQMTICENMRTVSIIFNRIMICISRVRHPI